MQTTKTYLTDGVMDLSYGFMKRSVFVSGNPLSIAEVAQDLKKEAGNYSEFWLGYPSWVEAEKPRKSDNELLEYELLAGSINYQYWYGKHDVRPNSANSTLMYHLLDQSFVEEKRYDPLPHLLLERVVLSLIKKLTLFRFPNLENRIKHLKEILLGFEKDSTLYYLANHIRDGEISVEEFLEKVITSFPGYASDMFLKRAFLLTMMLYRRVKWFADEIHIVPIPADYQIPKMLRWLNCIEYHSLLSVKVDGHDPIPYGSLMECEIRAASIMTCESLAQLADVSMCDVDTYLFLNRKKCDDPFHLTVTTDY